MSTENFCSNWFSQCNDLFSFRLVGLRLNIKAFKWHEGGIYIYLTGQLATCRRLGFWHHSYVSVSMTPWLISIPDIGKPSWDHDSSWRHTRRWPFRCKWDASPSKVYVVLDWLGLGWLHISNSSIALDLWTANGTKKLLNFWWDLVHPVTYIF